MRRSLGLEIGAEALRWVELEEAHGRVTVHSSGVRVLSGSGANREAEALRGLVGEHRWRGREVVVALPREAVTLRWLMLPAASREETAGMVELEAAQALPFPADEAAWDFRSTARSDGRQDLLLVAARRAPVRERRELVEGAGLRLGAVSADPLATAAVYQMRAPGPEETAILIHLSRGSVALSCVQGQRLLLSRSVPVEQPTAEDLAVEVRRTLVAGAMVGGEGTSGAKWSGSIWLTGPGATEELADGLAAALSPAADGQGSERARFYDRPEDDRPAVPAVGLLSRGEMAGGEELMPSLDTALGLALIGLRPAPDRLDLARQVRPVVRADAVGPVRRVRILAGVGAATVVATILLLRLPGAGDRELATAASRAQADARQLATRRRQAEERVRLLRGAVIPAHSYLDVLNDVSALAGPDVWLTQFTYDRGRPIVIRGAAKSNLAVARLVEGLRGSRHLERVTLGSVTQTETKESRYMQFAISGTLRGDMPLEPTKRGARARARSGA
jgi:Tfp pilus assembly protein PilN